MVRMFVFRVFVMVCALAAPVVYAGGAAESDAAGAGDAGAPVQQVTCMLDWVPNVNHVGIFVAQDRGFFADEGLAVDIIQPGEVAANAAVASGRADFGVGFQENLTLLRADDVPLVSIAAMRACAWGDRT